MLYSLSETMTESDIRRDHKDGVITFEFEVDWQEADTDSLNDDVDDIVDRGHMLEDLDYKIISANAEAETLLVQVTASVENYFEVLMSEQKFDEDMNMKEQLRALLIKDLTEEVMRHDDREFAVKALATRLADQISGGALVRELKLSTRPDGKKIILDLGFDPSEVEWME